MLAKVNAPFVNEQAITTTIFPKIKRLEQDKTLLWVSIK